MCYKHNLSSYSCILVIASCISDGGRSGKYKELPEIRMKGEHDKGGNIQTNVRLFQTNACQLSTNIPLRQ
jgi:hypothetical protein